MSNRRHFVKSLAATGAAFHIVPRHVLGGRREPEHHACADLQRLAREHDLVVAVGSLVTKNDMSSDGTKCRGAWWPTGRQKPSPRGSVALLHASKAWAWLSGKDFVTPDDVKAIAKPALRHRLQLRPGVLGATLRHLSNADTGRVNPGMETLALLLAMPLE